METSDYDVFGEPTIYDANDTELSESAFENLYFFTGRRYDGETGLYYYRARYYNPAIGRFLQTDPIGYAIALNLYVYCINSPVNWTDPSGLKIEIKGDKVSVEKAVKYLSSSPTFVKTYKYLDGRKEIYTVETIKDHIDRYSPRANAIYWDPTSALKTSSGGTQSPALGLAHELEHAKNDAEGDIDMTPDKRYEFIEERNVITGPEMKIARDLGEDIRTDHKGSVYRSRGSTQRCKK